MKLFGRKKEDVGVMTALLEQTTALPSVGDTVDGKVINRTAKAMYVDLPPYGTGIIYGREYIVARDLIRKMHHGDEISAKVVDVGNEDGYVELSLKEAKQALIWGEVEDAIANKTQIEVPVLDANKGGLILSWQGVHGFLPASQLSSEHYPRVEDGDKDRILEQLRRYVGEKFVVTIIGATPEDGKLIFSEKGIKDKEITAAAKSYSVGDKITGEVTGMVDFGVFVKIGADVEGLVHISEIDWGLVEDPRTFYKVGDKVDVKVIEVKDGKVSLSIKALKPNPWTEASKKYKKGDVVKGVVIKFNKHGALASIEEGVAGLVHISEFGTEDKLRDSLSLGTTYDFKITLFDPNEQKMTLSTNLTAEATKKEEK